MDSKNTNNFASRVERELSTLKLLSRLLGHELHSQNGQRIQLSRPAVVEFQTTLDLFIEKVTKARGNSPLSSTDTTPVEAGTIPARSTTRVN